MSKDAKAAMPAKRTANRKNRNKIGMEGEQQGEKLELPIRESISGGAAAASTATPEYRFLQLNEGGYKPTDLAARKLIRSHVMRNYFQEKRTQSEDASLASSASTVNAKNSLKGRWRLGKEPLVVSSKQVTDRKGVKDLKSQREGARTSPVHRQVQQSFLPHEQSPPFSQMSAAHNGALQPTAPPLEMFQASIRDPFDSMSVATSNPRSNRLVHFYQVEFMINSLVQNPTRTLFTYVINNEGLLHSMLAIVALYMHGHRGINVKADILYHRGEALQTIHRGLANPSATDICSLLATMLTMASFENLCGNFYNSRAHLTAMKSLIRSAGGIRCFSGNDSLLRGVAWAQYHYAAATRTVPAFRYSPAECGHPDPPIPEQIMFEAAKDISYSLALINKHGHSIYNGLRALHIIALGSGPEWAAARHSDLNFRYALSNLVLTTEYDLLVLSHQIKSETTASVVTKVGLSDVCDCICAAAQIFLFAGLRGMPLGARVIDLYLSRVGRALHSEALIENWNLHASLDSLLWTLAVTTTAANGRAEYLPGMNQLRKLCGILEISDVDNMVARLKGFIWNEAYQELGSSVLKDLFRRASYPLDRQDDRSLRRRINGMQPPSYGLQPDVPP